MGTLFVVATPIGNLNDFSKRAEETLRQSNLILVEDTRQTIKLLNHFDIKVKMLSYHKFNERERVSEIINLLNELNNYSDKIMDEMAIDIIIIDKINSIDEKA